MPKIYIPYQNGGKDEFGRLKFPVYISPWALWDIENSGVLPTGTVPLYLPVFNTREESKVKFLRNDRDLPGLIIVTVCVGMYLCVSSRMCCWEFWFWLWW